MAGVGVVEDEQVVVVVVILIQVLMEGIIGTGTVKKNYKKLHVMTF